MGNHAKNRSEKRHLFSPLIFFTSTAGIGDRVGRGLANAVKLEKKSQKKLGHPHQCEDDPVVDTYYLNYGRHNYGRIVISQDSLISVLAAM